MMSESGSAPESPPPLVVKTPSKDRDTNRDNNEEETQKNENDNAHDGNNQGANEGDGGPKPAILNIPQVPTTVHQQMETAASPALPQQAAPPPSNEDESKLSGKLTLSTLLSEGLISSGEGVLTIDYLGQTFTGDLLPSGQIRSQETGQLFNNPSAWAIYCKKIVNPSKKSGCGWASVKYKGRKMDHFKTVWNKRKSERDKQEFEDKLQKRAAEDEDDDVVEVDGKTGGRVLKVESKFPVLSFAQMQVQVANAMPAVPQVPDMQMQQMQLQDGGLPTTAATNWPFDPTKTLLGLDAFAEGGLLQPFTVSLASSAHMIVDLHIHLASAVNMDAVGYLAGQWDWSAQHLAITHAFPCEIPQQKEGDDGESSQDGDDEGDSGLQALAQSEFAVYTKIHRTGLSLVGWYRSSCDPSRTLPTVADCCHQLENQIKLLGQSDATYTPCVGLLSKPSCSAKESATPENDSKFFWILPPQESAQQTDCGQPMKLKHSDVRDRFLSELLVEQIEELIKAHKKVAEAEGYAEAFFSEKAMSKTEGKQFLQRMGRSLAQKFPLDQGKSLWKFILTKMLGVPSATLTDSITLPSVFTSAQPQFRLSTQSASRASLDPDDEEEIDDDEENALRSGVTITQTTSPAAAAAAVNLATMASMQPDATEKVISMLLQKQAPVAPRAHEPAGMATLRELARSSEMNGSNGNNGSSNDAPLDFSALSRSLLQASRKN